MSAGMMHMMQHQSAAACMQNRQELVILLSPSLFKGSTACHLKCNAIFLTHPYYNGSSLIDSLGVQHQTVCLAGSPSLMRARLLDGRGSQRPLGRCTASSWSSMRGGRVASCMAGTACLCLKAPRVPFLAFLLAYSSSWETFWRARMVYTRPLPTGGAPTIFTCADQLALKP